MSGAGFLCSVATLGGSRLKTLRASERSSGTGEAGRLADVRRVIVVVDQLYDANEMEKALAFLEGYSDSEEAEILWRLARLSYKVCCGYAVCQCIR